MGCDSFFAFLRHYFDLYHGRLVHSSDFLRLFFQTFCIHPAFQDYSIQENSDYICSTWLDIETMPASITRYCQTISNELSNEVSDIQKRRSRHPKRVNADIANLLPEQLLLFLERMLANSVNMKRSSQQALEDLKNHIDFRQRNADIQHFCRETTTKKGQKLPIY